MNLAYFKTSDHIELPALLFNSNCSSRTGAIFVHGKAGNLTQKHLTTIAEALALAGIPSLTFNNRGAEEGGNAREFFDDSLLDITGAINCLKQATGCTNVVLLGHSYGGLKAAFYAASNLSSLIGLVLMSSIPHLQISEELVKKALAMQALNESELIFSQKEGDYLHLYQGAAILKNRLEGYQGLTVELLKELECPIFSFASEEEWEWFHEVPLTIAQFTTHNTHVRAEVLRKIGDHCYTDHESFVAETVVDWVLSVVLPGIKSGE